MAIKSVSISPEFLEGEDGSALTFDEADFVNGVWERKVQAKTDSDGDSCDVIVVTDSKNDDGSDMTAKETIEIERTVIALFDKVKSVCKVGISYQVGYTITGEKEKDDLVRFPSGVTRVDYVFDSDDGTDANVSVGEWTGDSELRKTSSVSVDKPGTLTLYLYINDALFDRLSIVFAEIMLSDLIEALKERGVSISEDADLQTAIEASRTAMGMFGYQYEWSDPQVNSNGYLNKETGGAVLTKYDLSLIGDDVLSSIEDKEKIILIYGYISSLKYNVLYNITGFSGYSYYYIRNEASASVARNSSSSTVDVVLKAEDKFKTSNPTEEYKFTEHNTSMDVCENTRFNVSREWSNTTDTIAVNMEAWYKIYSIEPFYLKDSIMTSRNGSISIRCCRYYNKAGTSVPATNVYYFKKYKFENRFISNALEITEDVEMCKDEIRNGGFIKRLGNVNKYYTYSDFAVNDFRYSRGILLEMSDLKHVA